MWSNHADVQKGQTLEVEAPEWMTINFNPLQPLETMA